MGADLLAAAMDELYALDPSEFIKRRNALAAAARKAQATDDAAQIAALRRPSRAAWIVNRLAREHPELASDFADLGEQLRAAHTALDGEQIRELSKQRRHLIDHTAAQAFATAGVLAPTAALRDEITATLGAVLADSSVAARFASGVLVTAEDASGFGPSGVHLAALPSLKSARPAAGAPSRSDARPSRPDVRRQAAMEKAEQALADAVETKVKVDDEVAEATADVHQLTEQLADAKRREDDALLAARHAEIQVEKAQQAIARLMN